MTEPVAETGASGTGKAAGAGEPTTSAETRRKTSSNSNATDLKDYASAGENSSAGDRSTSRLSSSTVSHGSITSGVVGSAPSRMVTSFRGVALPEHKGHMPRAGHTIVIYKRNIYLFGGSTAKGQYMNHIYRHEKRSLQWEEVRGSGVVPTGRANHSAVLIGEKMYVYGGHRNLDVFDDLFCYNMESIRWDRIAYEKTQGPGPCFLHAAVYVPITQSMIVLGGFHQREHNTYLGHAFDIQNKVWSGIPGPAEANPQHLQLVTAAFHSPRDVVIVIGIVDNDDAISRSEEVIDMPPSSVYMVNVHSYAWTNVVTTSSPESPIPFRLDIVWERFMREFVMMGGLHEEAQGYWYFPVYLGALESALLGRSKSMTSDAEGSASGHRSATKTTQYGFFALNLMELNWSILPAVFPKKFLAILASKNRERMSNLAIQMGAAAPQAGGAGAAGAMATTTSAMTHAGDGSKGALQGFRMSIVSLDAAAMDAHAERQPPVTTPQKNSAGGGAVPTADPAGGAAQSRSRAPGLPGSAGNARASFGSSGSGTGGGGLAAAAALKRVSLSELQGRFAVNGENTVDRFRKLLLYTVQGAPQFERKYAYAACRDGSSNLKGKKPKPMKYFVMHGGLSPGEDYTMLMFTPVATRVETNVGRRSASINSATNMGLSGAGGSFFGRPETDEEAQAVRVLRNLVSEKPGDTPPRRGRGREGRESAAVTITTDNLNDPPSQTRRKRGGAVPIEQEADPFSSLGDDTESEIFGGGSSEGHRSDRLREGGATSDDDSTLDQADNREVCLLPILPCTRNATNRNRFAVLFTAANSVRDTSLLPYANCPVAILESEKDVVRWSGQHYLDTRRWLSVKLKDAVAEDKLARQARRKRLRQLQQQQQPSNGAASRLDAALDSSDDDSDSDSTLDATRSAAAAAAAAGGAASDRKGGATNATEQANPTAAEMASAVAQREKERCTFVKDFFEKRGLDVFNLDDFLAVQAAARAKSGKADGDGGNGASATDMSLLFLANAPGMERLFMNAKRREEQQRLPTSVFQQGAGGAGFNEANALTDLGSAMAYVLMHNALVALDGDISPEAASRRAQIRWRFLRALVRTGEAAFIIYRATQEASKMRAVKVTSTPGLLLAPELQLIGPTRAYKVPSRPIPYTLPRPAKQTSRFAEVTPSGMVVYHNMKHVK